MEPAHLEIRGFIRRMFAFLIHPLSGETEPLMRLDGGGVLRTNWGSDILQFCLDSCPNHSIRPRLVLLRPFVMMGTRLFWNERIEP